MEGYTMHLLRDLLTSVDDLKEADLVDGEERKPGEEVLDIELTLDQKKLHTRYTIMTKAASRESKKLYREYLLFVADHLGDNDGEAITAAKETFDRSIAILNSKLRLLRDALFACIKATNPSFAMENIVAVRKGWRVVASEDTVPLGMGGLGSMFTVVGAREAQW